jgi:hypothetical protein
MKISKPQKSEWIGWTSTKDRRGNTEFELRIDMLRSFFFVFTVAVLVRLVINIVRL